MHFLAVLASALSLATLVLAVPASSTTTHTWQITYDTVYDKKSNSLDIVACSNGKYGLETRGYTTFGSLPATYVGGVQAVAGWNSANCGTCWQVSYNGTTINVLAIDHADSGVNLGENAMNKLTHGHAVQRGVVHAKVKQVDAINCGFGRKFGRLSEAKLNKCLADGFADVVLGVLAILQEVNTLATMRDGSRIPEDGIQEQNIGIGNWQDVEVPFRIEAISKSPPLRDSHLPRPSGAGAGASGFEEAVVEACEGVVENYRRREISKVDAVLQLYKALHLDEVVEADEIEERNNAYRSYFAMLEDIDHDQRVSESHDPGAHPLQNQTRTHDLSPEDPPLPGQGDRERSSEQRRELNDAGDRRSLLERLTEPQHAKRHRTEYDDASEDEMSQDGKRARPRRNIDDSLFPFLPSGREEVGQLSDDLQRTLVLKENYTRDLAFAKQSVVCSPRCPPVPDAVWTDVLANRYVDLDRIFSAIYTVDGDSKNSVKLGDFELSGLPSKPKRRIERHGHWTIAWALYQRAVLYVYPHRERELRTYYDQINGFFAAVSEAEASRIVNLDRAIRGEVGRSNTLLLSDFSRFNHLYTMHVVDGAEVGVDLEHPLKPASVTMKADAPPATAGSDMSAHTAPDVNTSPLPALKRRREEPAQIDANKRPRRFRGFLWDQHDNHAVTPLATLSESMAALPSPPLSELQNTTALQTIRDHPHLFDVVSPLNVDRFQELLATHPNRALVDSVCRGFREGFWPFANPSVGDFPSSWEESSSLLDDEALQFASKYAEEEEAAGRYSAPFSGDLLPGMYSMPVHAVPKPHSDKMRFINNHSAGRFSLNSMINKHEVGMRPDNVQDLARNLLHFRSIHGDAPVWLFKSDIANAYRLLPMHPLWQLKQVVSVNGLRRIDRCCCFC
ncbi:hypothetical protein BN946_scf184980.g2 [Trametes cinnabarina]|uniref:Uncharacterized protein n=1 Tax=Pycnoporus cinnabarinus TaxID=5643 RepID=A0A060SE27_PYCCI|nr:hypothetical protein BN946_scf184980.g2 [Trametes cinnabarina]